MTHRAGWYHSTSKSNTVSEKSWKMRSATYRWILMQKIEKSHSSIRSKFDLNSFPEIAWHATYTSRKDFDAYRLYRGWKLARRLHIGAEKKWKIWIFKKFDFFESWSLKFHFSKLFQLSFEFVVTRRAGWSHPTSKSNTVSGKSWKMRSATYR